MKQLHPNDMLTVVADLLGDRTAAHEVLETYGTLRALDRAPVRELVALPGIGPTKAARLKAAFELGRRAAAESLKPGRTLRTARDVYEAIGPTVAIEDRETFWVLGLDVRNRIRVVHQVATGSLIRCSAVPRDVFLPLVQEAAARAILVHNHPSGDPEPSPEDIVLTKRLKDAGQLIGIEILDHIVVATEGYVSLAERGAI